MHLQSSEFGIFYYNIIPYTEFVNLFIGILVPYLALFVDAGIANRYTVNNERGFNMELGAIISQNGNRQDLP